MSTMLFARMSLEASSSQLAFGICVRLYGLCPEKQDRS